MAVTQQEQPRAIRSFINSPWLLITIPCLVGGVWLANNTWIITSNLDKPYLLLAGPVLVGSILVGIFFKKIIAALQSTGAKVMTRTGFFWAVNIVFMAVSVLHAGSFFGITGNGHDVPGIAQYLGFAVSFFLDLVTIVLIQAMLEARYRGEDDRAKRFLMFIAICCATSTFANLAISLNDFSGTVNLPHAPVWVQVAAPYVLASFPLFVIMMSLAAEMIVNVRPLDSLNEEEYEADEKKRIHLLEIRATYLQKQADQELRILAIRGQMKMNNMLQKGKLPHAFRWPWEKPLDVDQLVTGVAKQLESVYASKVEQVEKEKKDLSDHYGSLCQLVETNVAQLVTVVTTKLEDVEEQTAQLMTRLETNIAAKNEAFQSRLATQYDQDISLIKSQAETRVADAIEAAVGALQMEHHVTDEVPSEEPSDMLEQALDFLKDCPDGTEEQLGQNLELEMPVKVRQLWVAAQAIIGTNLQDLAEQRSIKPSDEHTQALVPTDGTLTREDDPQTDEIRVPENAEQNGTGKGRRDGIKSSATKRSVKRKPITNAEAAKELNCTERHIRNLRSNGTLLPDITDEHLILATSFNAYLARRSRQAVRV